MTPYFSVITPSWNQGAWLDGCIQSVLAQGVEDFEHIVFDNCSTDKTAAILAQHPHLQTHIEPDTGQANALNKGFRMARGEIICWLNTDDQYLPGTLARVREEFRDPAVNVIYGDCEEKFFDGRPSGVRKARFRHRDDFLRFWRKDIDILQPAVFFRRRIFEEVGYLREDLHICMDYEFWWRVAERHAFKYLGIPLALQQRQPDSKTVKLLVRLYEEKEKVFSPLLDAAQPRHKLRNHLAARIGMGERWLGLAQSAGANSDRVTALDFLRRARNFNPLLLLTPRWWAAFLHIHRQRRSV